MKWFTKVLRHYADFSGRARRKEYWMFTLFALIFYVAWMLLGSQLFKITPLVLALGWFGMLALPGLAVAMRRLHDRGKSGWWMLILLIPYGGAIWLLILMMLNGQAGANRFGPDPKTSPEAFVDRAKLTSAGIALTVAASLGLLANLIGLGTMPPLRSVLFIVLSGLTLAAGIMLINSRERENARPALWILMTVAFVALVRNLVSPGNIISENVIFFLYFLSIILLTASLLFAPKKRELVRSSAMVAIVVIGLFLLSRFWAMRWWGNPEGARQVVFLLEMMISPVAYMLLAWTFLSKKEEPIEIPAEVKAQASVSEPSSAISVDGEKPATLSGEVALLHLYRPGKLAGAMIGYDVHLDDKVIWRAKNGGKTTIELTREGPATLMAKTESRRELPLQIRLGCEYYVRCGMVMGVAVGRPKLELVDNDKGKAEFGR